MFAQGACGQEAVVAPAVWPTAPESTVPVCGRRGRSASETWEGAQYPRPTAPYPPPATTRMSADCGVAAHGNFGCAFYSKRISYFSAKLTVLPSNS